MGCRPSKHATSKIRDAHARANNSNCMYSPRKYHKKHKCNSNGTGSRRTSGGTQSGSHGHSSTGHRSRSHKSDDTEFPAFSTTTAVYRRSASKASKITLRLSSDGSTLEIEQCEYDITKSKPLVQSVSRPWSSAPNLTKVPTKDSPMFRNTDLSLRPSASAWTNAPGSRWTPRSYHTPGTWRKHTAGVKAGEAENQTKVPECGIQRMDIRETALVSNDSNPDGTPKEGCLGEEHTFNVSDHGQPVSGYQRENVTSNSMPLTMVRPIGILNGGNFQLHNQNVNLQQSHPTNTPDFSQTRVLNLCSLTQFGQSFDAYETAPKSQHKERCTATLRNPESSRRSGYHYNSEVHRFQCYKEENNSSNIKDNSCEVNKLNQRASIPRYDCFRIRDYNNIYSQSTSSILDHSFQNGDQPEPSPCHDWLDQWHKPTKQRPRSQYDNCMWTEKLTDREKLVLNLSARPSPVGVGGNDVGFTALVGRRDEDWHSNDNLISQKMQKQPFISFLSSPVESDAAVLRFVELGCPVSCPNYHSNTEINSALPFYPPAHVSTCLTHRSILQDKSYYDKISEMSKQPTSPNSSSHTCESNPVELSSKGLDVKGKSSFDIIVTKDSEGSAIKDGYSAEDIQYCTKEKLIVSPGTPVNKTKSEVNEDLLHKIIECDPNSDSIKIWRETEARSFLVQANQYVLEMKHFNVPAMTFPQPTETIKPDHENWTTQGRGQHGRDENHSGWIESTSNEDSESVGQAYSARFNEDGKENEGRRSMVKDTNRDRLRPDGGCERNFVETEGNGKTLPELLKNQNDFPGHENNAMIKGETMLNHNPYFQIKEGHQSAYNDDAHGSNRVRTQSLPLLCYNNSFGEQFLGSDHHRKNRGGHNDTEIPVNKIENFHNSSLRMRRKCNRSERTPVTNNVTSSSLDTVNEKRGLADEMFNAYRDKIDTVFHPPQSMRGESEGASPSMIKSTYAFHQTIKGKEQIDTRLDSEKPLDIEFKALIAHGHSITPDLMCYGGQLDGISHEAAREENEDISVPDPKNANNPILDVGSDKKERKEEVEMTYDLQQSMDADKINRETMTGNSFHSQGPLPTSSVTPIIRSPIPFRILQARIIGRNISDFANRCLKHDHYHVPSIACNSTKPITTSTQNKPAVITGIEDDAILNHNKDWMPANSPSKEETIPSHISNTCYDDSIKLTTKSELHSKYALTQARLTDEIKLDTLSSSSPQRTANAGRHHLSDSCRDSCSEVSIDSFLPQKPAMFNSSENVHSLKSSSEFHAISSPSTSFTANRLLGQISSHVVLTKDASSNEENTPHEDGMTNHRCADQSSPLTVPLWVSSSSEPYALANAQLLSSHSSDSLSCSLSSYSLSNTLHSENAHSDTLSSDTVHSDTPPSDTPTHCDTPSVYTPQTNTLQLNDTLQCCNPLSSDHQSCFRQPDNHQPATPPSNTDECTTPSSFPSSQSHSPPSTPHSTISPHSSPSSQCTLSPHSTPSSSPSPRLSIDQNHPDITSSLHDDPLHYYTGPNNKTLSSSFSPSSYSLLPSPLPPLLPPILEPHGAMESGLSILAPSTSCRGTLAENPKSHQKQAVIDLDDRAVLNPDEIQNSLWNSPCDCNEDHSVKWNATISGETSHKLQILSSQNGRSLDNRTTLSDKKISRESKATGHEQEIGDKAEEENCSESHCPRQRGITEIERDSTDDTGILIRNVELREIEEDEGEKMAENGLRENIETGLPIIFPPSILPIAGNFTSFQPLTENSPPNENRSIYGQVTDGCDHLHGDETPMPLDGQCSSPECGKKLCVVTSPITQRSSGSIQEPNLDILNSLLSTSSQILSPFERKADNEKPLSEHRSSTGKRAENCNEDDMKYINENRSERLSEEVNIEQEQTKTDSYYFITADSTLEVSVGLLTDLTNIKDDPSHCNGNSDKEAGSDDDADRELKNTGEVHQGFGVLGNHRNEVTTNVLTSANDNIAVCDGLKTQESEGESHKSNINIFASGIQALGGDNQDELLTPVVGLADQIDIETAKQISENSERVLSSWPDVASHSTNTHAYPIAHGKDQGIDSSLNTVTPCVEHEQTMGRKRGRQKRNVQYLVKHFETVSLKSHVDAQGQDKL